MRGFIWFRPPDHNTLRPLREYCCIVVSCSSIELNLSERTYPEIVCLDSMAAPSFYSTRHDSYKKTRRSTCDPEVIETLLQHLGY
jgi:hypothetical protein